MSKTIVCIVGESGSGKTTLSDAMIQFGFTSVESYTTRQSRKIGERGHIFVSKEKFDKLEDIVAYTEFHGHEYAATRQQLEDNHLYVIDPDGILTLAKRYGRDNIVIVHIKTSEDERFNRMLKDRGFETAIDRVMHDEDKFASLYGVGLPCKAFYTIINEDLNDLTDAKNSLKELLCRWFPS